MVRIVLICLLIVICNSISRASETYAFFHSNVLGTHFELRLNCSSSIRATTAETLALEEIDRLSGILSSYSQDSELNRWAAAGIEKSVSQELREVLDASQWWHATTHGAFHPGVELLSRIWRDAEEKQQFPSDETLAAGVASLRQMGWKWNADHSAVAPEKSIPLTFNAIGKGYIIDSVCSKLSLLPGIDGGLVAIGGDMRAFGQMKRLVNLNPPVDDLAATSVATIELHNHSIATSSGAFRGVMIGDKRLSHLIDPRSGSPVSKVRSVTIVAANAMDADALATACSILSPHESLELVEACHDTACLIVDANGKQFASDRWREFERPTTRFVTTNSSNILWNGGMELKIDFAINQPEGGSRYRRPYVAVWIEDKDDFPVRTLVLWLQTTGKGSNWIPDLKRWYRNDRLRKLADGTDLIPTVSEATRKPNAYSVIWNGQDDNKKLVGPGEYTLCIEAAREHGTYQLIRKKLSFNESAFQEKLDENIEIKAATIEYRKQDAPK